MQIRSKLPQFRWLLSTADYRFVYYHGSQLCLSALARLCCDEQTLRSQRLLFRCKVILRAALSPPVTQKALLLPSEASDQLNSWEHHCTGIAESCVLAFESLCLR